MNLKRIEILLQYIAEDSTDTFSYYALALEYQALGDINKAIAQLQQLKINVPNYLPTYYTLGKLLEQNNDVNEAIINYKLGVELARQLKDNKTLGELNEALLLLDALDD
jgi:tetratricopeptide (TPR) repeat protein